MKPLLSLLTRLYGALAVLFAAAATVLMVFAFFELLGAVAPGSEDGLIGRAAAVIRSIGLLAIALLGIEMSQTVVEEGVLRRLHVSAPTRVRRYLSRFLVVVVVALSIESLVAVMQALDDRPDTLPDAAFVALAAAAILAAWGLFVRLNRGVEARDPEGIREARNKDRKVQ